MAVSSTAKARRATQPPADRPAASRATARKAKLAAQSSLATHHEDDSGELFGIADLCAEFEVSPRTLRFYETKGLLAPRRVNGARIYTRRDRARLALILRAKALGTPLDEIRRYLDLYGNHGEGRTQQLEYVVELTTRAIEDLELKRQHIETTLAELRVINDNCLRQLDERRRGKAG